VRRWQGRHPYLGGESACPECRADRHAWTSAQTETFALPYGQIRLYHYSCACSACLLRCGAGLVHVDVFADGEQTMEITFTPVPPEKRTALPVREEGVHLASFTPLSSSDAGTSEDEETDDEEGPAFSYFPRQKSGGKPLAEAGVEIPQVWPDVDEDAMRHIIDRLGEL
jgi:hypothetical protein